MPLPPPLRDADGRRRRPHLPDVDDEEEGQIYELHDLPHPDDDDAVDSIVHAQGLTMYARRV